MLSPLCSVCRDRGLHRVLLLGLLVPALQLGHASARADEPPAHSTTITSLDPNAARVLGDKTGDLLLDGLTSLDGDTARALAAGRGFHDSISLNGLTTLDADVARVLVNANGCRFLHFNGLTKLPAETATVLATFGGLGDRLYLEGLTRLDAAAARGLATSKATLYLSSLTELDAATAAALAMAKGWDGELPRLARLDAATARALAACEGRLVLDGLTRLDAEAARGLGEFKGHYLSLAGLGPLDAATAPAVGCRGFNGRLPNVFALDAETAAVLAESRADMLVLDELTSLDAETARVLARFKGRLYLNGLTMLDAATAEALATFSGGELRLGRVMAMLAEIGRPAPLTQQSARLVAAVSVLQKHLSQSHGKPGMPERDAPFTDAGISLPGVTSFDTPDAVEIARILATAQAPLALANLKRISLRTLSALLEREGISIPRIETLELIPEPDGSPNDDFVIPDRGRGNQR